MVKWVVIRFSFSCSSLKFELVFEHFFLLAISTHWHQTDWTSSNRSRISPCVPGWVISCALSDWKSQQMIAREGGGTVSLRFMFELDRGNSLWSAAHTIHWLKLKLLHSPCPPFSVARSSPLLFFLNPTEGLRRALRRRSPYSPRFAGGAKKASTRGRWGWSRETESSITMNFTA